MLTDRSLSVFALSMISFGLEKSGSILEAPRSALQNGLQGPNSLPDDNAAMHIGAGIDNDMT